MKSNILAFGALAAAGFLAMSAPADAATVTFNNQSTSYFVPSVTDAGYVFTSTADGFGVNNNHLWPTNGTMHLMSWTNGGSTSGFTMQALNGAAFSLGTFDLGGGYANGSYAVSKVVVTGLNGTSSFTREFKSGVDFANAAFSTLDLGGLTATQFTFTAYGASNRASFDNFTISAPGAGGVPEPASWAMMIGGVALAGGALRRHRVRGKTAYA
ncbi:PEPxxWA-CTERM sorting domain-containing protein [uncultured Sphingomonas sp.]|uniref:PEPxxWA-CTERM sorting domain-containing protein n=1 Tax=uncultured Sphingomonas sp. TaxID=158754 RepID=UPI0025FA4BF8|nr:PEPxxWA-CTERM sorting domain-containing protein [uncultured Sphingomonas sp.]